MARKKEAPVAEELDYEAQRAARIAENKKRMAELGIHTTVAEINETLQDTKPPSQPRKRKQRTVVERSGNVRRSGRLQGSAPESFSEDEMFRKIGIDRLDLLPMRRRRLSTLDPETLAKMREERMADGGGSRSGIDSGLGVRLQGGRVYDSKLGVTCHWCRQKTLEAHVECTAEGCGGGARLPVAFCRMCLRNRHGEDIDQAIASNCWICPACRGGCGEGCTNCCNCGPCRKKAGLGPTHQLIKLARANGFNNVHDYLVHRNTGEEPEEIAARKETFPWGAFLSAEIPEEEEEQEEEEAEEEQQRPQRTASRMGATKSALETLATNVQSAGDELDQALSKKRKKNQSPSKSAAISKPSAAAAATPSKSNRTTSAAAKQDQTPIGRQSAKSVRTRTPVATPGHGSAVKRKSPRRPSSSFMKAVDETLEKFFSTEEIKKRRNNKNK